MAMASGVAITLDIMEPTGGLQLVCSLSALGTVAASAWGLSMTNIMGWD